MSFNLPKRQSTSKPPNTQSDHRPTSGLLKALLDTGRTKGSSATPAPPVISPNPNRDFQTQLDKMNNTSHSHQNQSQDMGSADARYGLASQRPGTTHNRNMSSVTQKSFQTGGYTSRDPTPGVGPPQFRPNDGPRSGEENNQVKSALSIWFSSANFSKPMTVARLGQNIYDGLNALAAKIQNCHGISPAVQIHLINETRRLDHELSDAQRLLQLEVDNESNVRNDLYEQIDHTETLLRNAQGDRDRISMERDQLQHTLNAVRMKEQKTTEKWERSEQKYKHQIEDLLKQVTVQEEQLKGKRALWLESNPGSSARREAMNAAMRDPFNSPSVSQRTGFDSGYIGGVGGSAASSSIRSPLQSSLNQSTPNVAPVGAPRGPRRRGNLPTGTALPARVLPASTWTEPSSYHNFKTEPSTPPLQSMALVPFSNETDPAPRYKTEFTKIYEMVEGWVKSYANLPNLGNDQKIARSNNVLWDFMMNCTYPGQRQDAHTHVMTLLNDPNTRCWFIMRMAVTYLTKDIMTVGVFYKFNPATDGEFDEVKKKLQELRGKRQWRFHPYCRMNANTLVRFGN
jgi:hypothetical protein